MDTNRLDDREGVLLAVVRAGLERPESFRDTVFRLAESTAGGLSGAARDAVRALLEAGERSSPGVGPDDRQATGCSVLQGVLTGVALRRLERVVAEHRGAAALDAAGLRPTSKILLVGAAGPGRREVGGWLAGQLGRTLVEADASALVSRRAGETAHRLAARARQHANVDTVLMLTHLDLAVRAAGEPRDPGDRAGLVAAALGCDIWPGVLIATAHDEARLGPEVLGRFGERVRLAAPDRVGRERILHCAAEAHGRGLTARVLDLVARATEGMTAGEVRQLATRAAAHSILRSDADASAALVGLAMDEVAARIPDNAVAREAFCVLAHREAGMSLRSVGALTGVNYETVRRMVRRHEERGWEQAD